jgi:hypothetical protein
MMRVPAPHCPRGDGGVFGVKQRLYYFRSDCTLCKSLTGHVGHCCIPPLSVTVKLDPYTTGQTDSLIMLHWKLPRTDTFVTVSMI